MLKTKSIFLQCSIFINNFKKMSKLVSVIMPSYNHENYVQKAIKSVIDQTYKNIELIVIDDGSKDLTWQKIKELEEECRNRFVNIYFETKENEGTCKTQNKLFSMVNGDYVSILASDDIMKPNMIEEEINFLENNKDYVFVVGDDEIIDKNSNIVGLNENKNVVPFDKAKFKTFAQFLRNDRSDVDFLSDKFGAYETLIKNNYIPNGSLIRMSAMRKVLPFTPEAPLEDYYMVLQLSKIGKIKFIDKVFYSYRLHSSNTSGNANHMFNVTKKTLSYEEKIVNRNGNEKWKDIFYSLCIKNKINLFGIIKYYRKIDFLNLKKKYILKIFGKEFLIRDKKIIIKSI